MATYTVILCSVCNVHSDAREMGTFNGANVCGPCRAIGRFPPAPMPTAATSTAATAQWWTAFARAPAAAADKLPTANDVATFLMRRDVQGIVEGVQGVARAVARYASNPATRRKARFVASLLGRLPPWR
jgi:hypothetical protein